MKLLYISNLFTGLESSIINNEWKPSGVPTVYKFLEKLSTKFNKSEVIFFTSNKKLINRQFQYNSEINLNFNFIYHYNGRNYFIKIFNYFNKLIKILKIIKNLEPKALYFDRSNFIIAIFFKLFSGKIIIWRLMGVTIPMHEFHYKTSIKSIIINLLLKIKLDLVICTQDGSGGKEWMSKYLNINTPRIILINGFNNSVKKNKLFHRKVFESDKQYLKLLFISRLVKGKGCEILCDSLIKLSNSNIKIEMIIIGDGPQKKIMESKLENSKFIENIKFLGSLPHNEVINSYNQCDLYISLNEMGSLINTNLEAIKENCCMINLDSYNKFNIDIFTKKIIPNACVVRLDRNNTSEHLMNEINNFYNNREKIKLIQNNMKKLDKKFIPSWDQRINEEYSIIEKL